MVLETKEEMLPTCFETMTKQLSDITKQCKSFFLQLQNFELEMKF